MTIEIIVYSLLIIVLLCVCDNKYSKKYYVPIKSACSASFLVLYTFHSSVFKTSPMLGVALIACFAGDVLMGLYNIKKKKSYIFAGLGLFMLAHILFVCYLSQMTGFSVMALLAPFTMVGIMLLIIKKAHLHMGKVLYPGLVYCYFVSLTCAKAIQACGVNMCAGLMFFTSDFVILFLYFCHFKRSTTKKIVHYINLVTYYLAILFFIVGM